MINIMFHCPHVYERGLGFRIDGRSRDCPKAASDVLVRKRAAAPEVFDCRSAKHAPSTQCRQWDKIQKNSKPASKNKKRIEQNETSTS